MRHISILERIGFAFFGEENRALGNFLVGSCPGPYMRHSNYCYNFHTGYLGHGYKESHILSPS